MLHIYGKLWCRIAPERYRKNNFTETFALVTRLVRIAREKKTTTTYTSNKYKVAIFFAITKNNNHLIYSELSVGKKKKNGRSLEAERNESAHTKRQFKQLVSCTHPYIYIWIRIIARTLSNRRNGAEKKLYLERFVWARHDITTLKSYCLVTTNDIKQPPKLNIVDTDKLAKCQFSTNWIHRQCQPQ